jgi:hypothetical protein
MKEKKEIVRISHDVDGNWQFHSIDEWNDYREVIMLVSLGEIIKRDITVLEVSDLPLGFIARRRSINDKWVIQENSTHSSDSSEK